MANRHGLIAGATGTGKTVTLRKMAEAFSDDGVPVFLVDVKRRFVRFSQSGHIRVAKWRNALSNFEFRWRELFKMAILCHFGM